MTEVSARVSLANGAAAILIDRARVFRILRAANQQAALRREEAAVASAARGEHAVHHVDAERDVVGELLGLADSHEIARAAGRKPRGDCARDLASEGIRFARGAS